MPNFPVWQNCSSQVFLNYFRFKKITFAIVQKACYFYSPSKQEVEIQLWLTYLIIGLPLKFKPIEPRTQKKLSEATSPRNFSQTDRNYVRVKIVLGIPDAVPGFPKIRLAEVRILVSGIPRENCTFV